MNPSDPLTGLNVLGELDLVLSRPAREQKLVPVFVPHPTIPGDYIFRIDNSTISVFQQCPRSAEYYVLNRRTSSRNIALVFGGALHKGLEPLYVHGFNPEALQIGKSRVAQHFLDNPCTMDWRTDAHACVALEKYYNFWKGDTSISVVNHNGAPFVERSFDIELGTIEVKETLYYPTRRLLVDHFNPEVHHPDHLNINNIHVHLIGRMDLLVNYFGKLMVLDHKTTSMAGETFYADFKIGQQPLCYTWAAKKIFGQRPDGFLLNALALRKPTPSGKPFEFNRQPYYYTDEQIDEWESDMTSLVADFLSHALRGYFPKSTTWCMGKYGPCKYHSVCTLPSAQRSAMLSTSFFSDVSWDPTADDA